MRGGEGGGLAARGGAEERETGFGEGEVDEVVVALDLSESGDKTLGEVGSVEERIGETESHTEFAGTDIVNVLPIAVKPLGGGLQRHLAHSREEGLEVFGFYDGNVFFDIVAYLVAYYGKMLGGESIVAAAEEAVAGFEMKIIS